MQFLQVLKPMYVLICMYIYNMYLQFLADTLSNYGIVFVSVLTLKNFV
jgi:hypothetical protein